MPTKNKKKTKGNRQMASDILVVDERSDIPRRIRHTDDEGHETLRRLGQRFRTGKRYRIGFPRLIFLDIWLQAAVSHGLVGAARRRSRRAIPKTAVVMNFGSRKHETAAIGESSAGAYDSSKKTSRAEPFAAGRRKGSLLKHRTFKREVTELKEALRRSGSS